MTEFFKDNKEEDYVYNELNSNKEEDKDKEEDCLQWTNSKLDSHRKHINLPKLRKQTVHSI